MVSESVYKDLNKQNKKHFKDVIKLFDQKMYKKSLKKCESVLETQPTHGETIAMKALIYNTIGRKKEAKELINKALMCNLQSFTSWHIKGMIDRSDKNFTDAKKCFQQSSKIEDDNQKIFRDLLLLELQVRDYEGAVTSITKIMQKQARNKVYCACYILVNHLAGNYDVAESFIEQNLEFLLNKMSRVEMNELYMYQATLFKANGKFTEAIKLLHDQEEKLVDKTARLELLAELYTLSDKQEEAIKCYNSLLDRNPSNMPVYYGLFKAHGVDVNNIDQKGEEQIAKILNERIEAHPRLLFLKRFLLNFLSDEATFREHFQNYCKYFLDKGIPSLVNDIEKMITNNQMKFRVVKETFEKYRESLHNDLTIDGEEQDPLQECFALFFLSQVHYIEGDYLRSLELIDQSIEHTPTFIEAYQFKAKILTSLKDSEGAEETFRKAHKLDTADRFLNAECAKYVLRNGRFEEANDIMKRWSVDSTSDEISSFDFQNMWYEVESGYSHFKKGRFLEAFQMFYFIEKHLVTMHQDFYDFHFFTMRKFMLRCYASIGKMQDSLRNNPHVQNGMVGMLRVLNKIYNKAESQNPEEKKAFEAWLKDEASKHKDEEPDKNNWEEYEEIHDPIDKVVDPTGAKALKRIVDAGIVNEANKKCIEYLTYNPKNRDLRYHAIKWFLRANKVETALISVKYLNDNHPDWVKTAYSNARFFSYVEKESVVAKLKEKQLAKIKEVRDQVLGDKDVKSYFESNTRDKDPHSLSFQRYYTKGMKNLFNEIISKAHVQNVYDILSDVIKNQDKKKEVLVDVTHLLKIIKLVPVEVKEELIELGDQVFWKFRENHFPEAKE